MDLMKEFPDLYFDLAIVDPPYGINAPNMQMGSNLNRKGNGYPGESVASKLKKGRLNQGSGKLKDRLLNTAKIDWDNEKPSGEYFEQLFRVSKNQIIWGGNYFHLPPTRGIAVWNKDQPWDNFSQCELAWTSFDYPAKLISLSNRGGANVETKIHPTQKPVVLYTWLLKNYAKPFDKIIDTHLGSGSIAIAVEYMNTQHHMGLTLTGSEIDKKYYDAAITRVDTLTRQGILL